MEASALVVALANGAFVLACGFVGVRLLLLARRTRKSPELLLGAGFVAMVVAIPCLAIGGLARLTVAEVRFPVVALGMLLLALSGSLQAAFTWRSFRPGARWAAGLVAAEAIAETAIGLGLLTALAGADPSARAFDAVHGWLLWIRLPMTAGYLWTAVEAWLQYGAARRREAIGLGDPVVRNRFLLWFLVTSFASANTVVSTVLHARGMGPTADPLAAAVLAFGGTVGSIGLWLVFLPPQGYLRWVTARSTS